MHISIKSILSIILFISASLSAQEVIFDSSAVPRDKAYSETQILVKFKNDSRRFRKIDVPLGTVLDKVKEYKAKDQVETAELNYFAYASISPAKWIPEDDYYLYQWHFAEPESGGIDLERAWNILGDPGSPGQGVIVAVLDTGVAYEDYIVDLETEYYFQAPDLGECHFVPGYDFINNDIHPNDDSESGHGTHVTGTIAQSTNNGTGVSGIAFDCSIMPVKVLDYEGVGGYDTIANGIIFAVDNGAQIINLSLGGPADSSILQDAVNYAFDNGVTVIAATGNDAGPISYPAVYENVIAVGATRYDKQTSYYSNFGPEIDIVAPGGDVYVDQNGDGYGDGVLQQTYRCLRDRKGNFDGWELGYYFFQGTSMATPHVTGVAALLVSAGTAGTPVDIKAALTETAHDLGPAGWDEHYGHGLLWASEALFWGSGPGDMYPVIRITEPNTGAVVSGAVTVRAFPTDDIGVSQVDFSINGVFVESITENPFEFDWDSTGTSDGNATVTAAVIDTAGQTNTHTITVFIDNLNNAPVSDAGLDQTAEPGESLSFDGNGSYDPDGFIISHEWSFSDGTLLTGAAVHKTFDNPGDYSVVLKVVDDNGAVKKDTALITIADIPPFVTAWVTVTIQMKETKRGWKASAAVTVKDGSSEGVPLSGVLVTGIWGDGNSASRKTGKTGEATFRSKTVSDPESLIFSVSNISKRGNDYIIETE